MLRRVILRRPLPSDHKAFLAAVRKSRRIHHRWVHAPSTPGEYRAYLLRLDQRVNWGWLVCLKATGEPAGVVNISNAVRGSFHSAYLSYYVFAGNERRGLMREALLAALRVAFVTLKLHRLEANIQPGNAASIALVRSCGFRKEGFSPRYLKIGGRWRDHERWAILADRRT